MTNNNKNYTLQNLKDALITAKDMRVSFVVELMSNPCIKGRRDESESAGWYANNISDDSDDLVESLEKEIAEMEGWKHGVPVQTN